MAHLRNAAEARTRLTGPMAQLLMAQLLMALLLIGAGCGPSVHPADLVIRGGRIVTMDPAAPEVEALAVTGDRIVARGTEPEINAYIGPETRVLQLGTELVVPGLIDAHAHFLGIGNAMLQLDLTTAGSFDEIVQQVASAAATATPGEWILGRGWHQEKWRASPVPAVDGLPLHTELSRVAPDNPVLLTHASGHAVMVNARAMELAGINRGTPDPPGGQIVRDAAGEPIGVLRENAESLVTAARSGADEQLRRRMARLAAEECLRKGVTTLHDAGGSFEDVEMLLQMAEAGELPVRLWIMLSASNEELAERLPGYSVHEAADHHITVGAIKRLMDGALGSHGAWLLEPYNDLPESTGLATISIPELRRSAELALQNHLQLCVHAIGDRANREVLDVYESVLPDGGTGYDHRWRIEHAQHLHPDDIPRFAAQGTIASMQPTHCTSDGPWVEHRLGKTRASEGAYVWRSLLDSGAVLCTGTDAPVEDVDPLATFYSAVSRRMADGTTFYPDQVMTRHEALYAATAAGAYAAFEEELKGTLEPGKLADIVVLSADILKIPEQEIPSTRVLYTIVGGTVQYRADDQPEPATS